MQDLQLPQPSIGNTTFGLGALFIGATLAAFLWEIVWSFKTRALAASGHILCSHHQLNSIHAYLYVHHSTSMDSLTRSYSATSMADAVNLVSKGRLKALPITATLHTILIMKILLPLVFGYLSSVLGLDQSRVDGISTRLWA
ncbi:hypothetical protein F4604DRAFT_1688175 [Suillus subluteus]|nr:hypothetical protein F4604DRAFT_1688175 [Suillus subluteus]